MPRQVFLSTLVHLVFCESPQVAGRLHGAAGVDGGGVCTSFSGLRLQEVLGDAVCRPWKKGGSLNQLQAVGCNGGSYESSPLGAAFASLPLRSEFFMNST